MRSATCIALAVLLTTPSGLPAAGDRPASMDGQAPHWAFQPLAPVAVPQPQAGRWCRGDIDRFLLERLEKEGLHPAPEADRVTWLRRVFLDLTGLPPTPADVSGFSSDQSDGAFEQVVDRLLASPRYGERWAQHWLDVVRYADTHGFEVNTERPNAWPYRDYVIRSFNRDTPYDRFVREQIAGDQLGEDAATGFLITASVLLPGQIGKDEPSIRLARQDALDEIVMNIGQTFLGLSVGCARCHDHKFDPITQADYYSMQAFVAGVEYEDRDLHTPEAEALREQQRRLRERIAGLDNHLAQLAPLARGGGPAPRLTEARGNVESFPATEARYVRFTIHDANLHPQLGLIEPCIDEFEIFTDEPVPRNVALASFGTRVTASGSRTSDQHRLEHINDGRYGNSRSWMSDEAGRGWVLFELPQPVRIARVVWSRDREGGFQDRLPTAYTLEIGMTPESLRLVSHVAPRRPAVNARMNTDRFAPVSTRRVRFTIRGTNGLEPCLDELEVYDEAGRNLALAGAGARVSSSGDTVVADRHELRFVNDGHYGNSRSWMSGETGKGWVMVEFPEARRIDRVVWGRDREGTYTDRLATNYVIEVAAPDGGWQTVADSGDRVPYTGAEARAPAVSLAGLAGDEARQARQWMSERKELEEGIGRLETGQRAFAGLFRKPDDIHLLRRGDPEQPREAVTPAVLRVLGHRELPRESGDAERRKALAEWIASPGNPLTARVMVNRIWQGHFGVGLVDTPSDFGRSGGKPSHPQLLDWLASEFIRSGWSIKHMHRLIVLSSAYRQSSRVDPAAQGRDAEDRWLWRYPSRRLEAESIRDAMLSVSGRLNPGMYGPGFDLFDKRGGLSGFKPVESYSAEGLRRMIYAHKVRREREAVFGAFDCPDAGQSTARRRESTTPLQALNLFNSRFTLDESGAFARRVAAEAGASPDAQVRRAYEWALGRAPTSEEQREARQVVRDAGLPVLCRALYNCNEFLYLP